MIAIDLSKEQTFDVDPKAIQQINFTGNLERVRNTIMNCESIVNLFCFNLISILNDSV